MESVSHPVPTLASYLAQAALDVTEGCTTCGKCVEVCPSVPFGAANAIAPDRVAGDLVGFLRNGADMSDAADAWAAMCNGCGLCIPACPEEINPRRMLMLAGIKHSTAGSKTPELFRRMSRSIKVMSAMQLVPEEFKRIFIPARPRDVSVVFYLGCNALRTPHLLFNSMTLLDALDTEYEVVGGPSACCGVIAAKWEGQIKTGERMTGNTVTRFENFKPERVLNWCPTCQLHLGETLEGYRRTSYSFDHLTEFLVEHLETLKNKFIVPVRKRVVVHAHAGRADICGNVETVLRSIPGLEIVETVVESGYTCGGSGCSKVPELAQREHAEVLDRTRALGADVLVTLYHGCHAAFIGAEKESSFKVLNWTDLVVEALGETPHLDRLKDYRMADDWAVIVDAAQPLLKANGVTLDDAFLLENGPEIFASAEFKGRLECFGDAAAVGAHAHPAHDRGVEGGKS